MFPNKKIGEARFSLLLDHADIGVDTGIGIHHSLRFRRCIRATVPQSELAPELVQFRIIRFLDFVSLHHRILWLALVDRNLGLCPAA